MFIVQMCGCIVWLVGLMGLVEERFMIVDYVCVILFLKYEIVKLKFFGVVLFGVGV